MFVVNDDVEAAIALDADGAHLGTGRTAGRSGPSRQACSWGSPPPSAEEARAGQAGRAAYIGAGPVWATPSKPDADPPIGLEGLAAIRRSVTIPVVAIGGIDATKRRRLA